MSMKIEITIKDKKDSDDCNVELKINKKLQEKATATEQICCSNVYHAIINALNELK